MASMMSDVIEYLAKGLVDTPDEVRVTETEEGDRVVIRLDVAEGDWGKVIGKGGRMLKTISQQAREGIESFLGTRVYLELWVKVLKNWRRDENALRRLGYRLPRPK